MSRLSHLLSGGKHVANVAMIWPINAMFAAYRPQTRTPLGDRIENDFNALTDLLPAHPPRLRLRGRVAARDDAPAEDGELVIGDERHELVVVPPMAHIQLPTLERLEQFAAEGGRMLGAVLLPGQAFGDGDMIDVRERVGALFGVDPATVGTVDRQAKLQIVEHAHEGGGKTAFISAASLWRGLPEARQAELRQPGVPESPQFVIEPQETGPAKYLFTGDDGVAIDIHDEVEAEREAIRKVLEDAVGRLIEPDIQIDNPERALPAPRERRAGHRVSHQLHRGLPDGPDRAARRRPASLWNPSTGIQTPIVPWRFTDGRTQVEVDAAPGGVGVRACGRPATGPTCTRRTPTSIPSRAAPSRATPTVAR